MASKNKILHPYLCDGFASWCRTRHNFGSGSAVLFSVGLFHARIYNTGPITSLYVYEPVQTSLIFNIFMKDNGGTMLRGILHVDMDVDLNIEYRKQ